MYLDAPTAVMNSAGWVRPIVSTARGSRLGLVAVFVVNGLVWVPVPIGLLLFSRPPDCLFEAGWTQVSVNTLSLLLGLLSAVTLGLPL